MNGQVLFVPHGGGPLPLMGHRSHLGLTAFLQGLEDQVSGSEAIVVFTAHWEADVIQISGNVKPSLLFDYDGFPDEAYEYEYQVSGAPDLALEASELLTKAGIDNQIDMVRGLDHGTFVPLMLVHPLADIPILQVSLLNTLDPAAHVAVGKAMSPILDRPVTLIGSGLSFHNLAAMQAPDKARAADAQAFDVWLNDTLTGQDLSFSQRTDRLVDWISAPCARFCHPREEHLLPLLVCFGAASARGFIGQNIFQEKLMGFTNSGFHWLAV